MKKVLLAAVLTLAGIYGTGYFNLGEAGVQRFLNKQEELTLNGEAQALCDSLTDDMQFKIKDNTARLIPGAKVDRQGGRNEMCEQMQEYASTMLATRPTTQLERRDFVVSRDLLHPWTARVSLTELRSTTFPKARFTLKTESDDRYVLVHTFGGVKIKELESEAFLQ